MSDDEILQEQVDYYRQRAGEYDDFWLRLGDYALPPDLAEQWRADAAEAEQFVADWAPAGPVLDVACGTGLWTAILARHSRSVTGVDASPEVIARNRERVGPEVELLVADLFEWQPPRAAYDGVCCGYWLSHVPPARLGAFLDGLRQSLRPGGSIVLVDSLPLGRRPTTGDAPHGQAPTIEPRRLRDGRRFRVVKQYRPPEQLAAELARLGWRVEARATSHQLILLATLHPKT